MKREEFTVEATSRKQSPLSPVLVFTTFMTCFGSSMLYGYNLAVINLPNKHIKCFLKETIGGVPCENASTTGVRGDSEFLYAQVSSVFVVFGAIGAFSTGWIADFFGRRNGLLVNHAFAIVGGVISGFTVMSSQPSLIFVGRAFIGINCGVTIGLASIYLTEIAPMNLRGAIGACHQLAVTFGIVVGYLITLSHALNSRTLWPVACSLTAIPAFISLCTLPFCPESPRFLYLKRHNEEASRQAFLRMNKTGDVEKFIKELKEELDSASGQPVFRFTQLFTEKNLRMPLLIACFIQIMQQLSGINAVISYSESMLRTAGIHAQYTEYCVLAIGVFNVLCTIASLPMLEKFGRRTLLLWPSVLLAACLLMLTVTVNLVSRARLDKQSAQILGIVSALLILAYISGFALGLGTVPALIVAELFRQGPRGAAYSVSQGIQWLATLLVLASFPNMNKVLGGYSFLIFFVIVASCWVFFFLYMPETRGRTFDDIAKDLETGKMVIRRKNSAIEPTSVLRYFKCNDP